MICVNVSSKLRAEADAIKASRMLKGERKSHLREGLIKSTQHILSV